MFHQPEIVGTGLACLATKAARLCWEVPSLGPKGREVSRRRIIIPPFTPYGARPSIEILHCLAFATLDAVGERSLDEGVDIAMQHVVGIGTGNPGA
jgi:hypothetical protein